MIAEKIKANRAIEVPNLTVAHPNPEIQDKALRRRFIAEYKLLIVFLKVP